MNLIKKTAIALSLFAISGTAAIAQTKTPAKATKTETVKTTKVATDKNATNAKMSRVKKA